MTVVEGTDVLQIKRGTDYGVRVMCHLAGMGAGRRTTLEEIAEATDVPSSFLSKIMQRLTAAGLIVSHRGATGGYTLGRPATQISLFDVITTLEGPLALNVCLMSAQSCHRRPACVVHRVWAEAQERVVEVLTRHTLSELAGGAGRSGGKGNGDDR